MHVTITILTIYNTIKAQNTLNSVDNKRRITKHRAEKNCPDAIHLFLMKADQLKDKKVGLLAILSPGKRKCTRGKALGQGYNVTARATY